MTIFEYVQMINSMAPEHIKARGVRSVEDENNPACHIITPVDGTWFKMYVDEQLLNELKPTEARKLIRHYLRMLERGNRL